MHAKEFKWSYTEDGSKLRECPLVLRQYLINNCQLNENIDYDRAVRSALAYNNINVDDVKNLNNKNIQRMIVNHLRHRESQYNENLKILNDVIEKKKSDYTYKQIKNITLYNIKQEFPWLEEACDAQHNKLLMIYDHKKKIRKNKKKHKKS